jgi:hypothetical protein
VRRVRGGGSDARVQLGLLEGPTGVDRIVVQMDPQVKEA